MERARDGEPDADALLALQQAKSRPSAQADMLVSEDGLHAYYRRRLRELRPDDVARNTSPLLAHRLPGSEPPVPDKQDPSLDIRYCYASGFGEESYECETESGTTTRTAISLDELEPMVEYAATRWAGVAKVRFNHVASLDGASCTSQRVQDGDVAFIVAHSGKEISQATMPSDEVLGQPVGGLIIGTCGDPRRSLVLHELGHLLGFVHEHVRPKSSMSCSEPFEYIELTEYDADSVMHYDACEQSQSIGDRNLSRRDGIGARKVYGNPDWWYAVLI